MGKLIIASLVFIGALGALGVSAAEVEIKMKNNGKDGMMVFEPGFVKIQPGDTIVFVPTDKTHNSASYVLPEGAKPWKGKTDETFKVTLDKEGVYIHKCDPHIPMAMAGVIQVGNPVNLTQAKAKATELSKMFMMHKDRLSKYLEQVK